jgi:rare lipoprotein A
MKHFIFLFVGIILFSVTVLGQSKSKNTRNVTPGKIQYGTASYYADKFNGRKTSNGEIFSQKKLTGAHNTLPLGTWVKVTNLKNRKSVVVKINDRLHHRNPRLIDLSKTAAQKLDYISQGLTKVKVEVLGKNPPPVAVK